MDGREAGSAAEACLAGVDGAGARDGAAVGEVGGGLFGERGGGGCWGAVRSGFGWWAGRVGGVVWDRGDGGVAGGCAVCRGFGGVDVDVGELVGARGGVAAADRDVEAVAGGGGLSLAGDVDWEAAGFCAAGAVTAVLAWGRWAVGAAAVHDGPVAGFHGGPAVAFICADGTGTRCCSVEAT